MIKSSSKNCGIKTPVKKEEPRETTVAKAPITFPDLNITTNKYAIDITVNKKIKQLIINSSPLVFNIISEYKIILIIININQIKIPNNKLLISKIKFIFLLDTDPRLFLRLISIGLNDVIIEPITVTSMANKT